MTMDAIRTRDTKMIKELPQEIEVQVDKVTVFDICDAGQSVEFSFAPENTVYTEEDAMHSHPESNSDKMQNWLSLWHHQT